jgi:hypothetical protein
MEAGALCMRMEELPLPRVRLRIRYYWACASHLRRFRARALGQNRSRALAARCMRTWDMGYTTYVHIVLAVLLAVALLVGHCEPTLVTDLSHLPRLYPQRLCLYRVSRPFSGLISKLVCVCNSIFKKLMSPNLGGIMVKIETQLNTQTNA